MAYLLVVHTQLHVNAGIHSTHQLYCFYHCPRYKVQVWMGWNTTSKMLQLSVTHHEFGLILQKEHFISRPICQHTNGIRMSIQSLWLNSLCQDQGFSNQPSEGSWTPKIIKWAWWLQWVAQQVLILLGLQGLCDLQFWVMVDSTWVARSMWFTILSHGQKAWKH